MSRNRLCLEILEDRTVPSNFATVVTIASVGPTYYTPSSQVECVTAQAMYTNGSLQIPVPAGTTINITDGGQTQSAQVGSNGQATATFCFWLIPFQEQPRAHTVSAQVPLQTFPFTSDTLLQSTNSDNTGQAPNTRLGFLFQLFNDYLLIVSGYGYELYN
jgi:hypothetical protein